MTRCYKYGTCAVALGALLVAFAASAQAQCCGTAPVAAYQPVAYQAAYAPVAYQAAYAPVAYQAPATTGWYPGYWLGRLNRRIWGVPEATYTPTYTAGYAPAYTTGYAPTYRAAYAPAYTTSYAPSYGASYAPSYSYAAPSYAAPASACTTCAMPVQTVAQAVLRPVCADCVPCCPSGVSQVSYETPRADCPTCVTESPASSSTPPYSQNPPSTYGDRSHQPELAPGERVPEQRSEAQRVPDEADDLRSLKTSPRDYQEQSEPAGSGETDADAATYFEAPRLFQPNDQSVQRSTAPVWMAVYQRPAATSTVSNRVVAAPNSPASAPAAITAEQAERDAAGWTSASR